MRCVWLLVVALGVVGCGDSPSTTTASSAPSLEGCGATQPATPPSTTGVPLALVGRAVVLDVQRAPGQLVARLYLDRSVTDVHDDVLVRAPRSGYAVTDHENEGKEAEVYLTKGAQKVTLRLNRAGRCAAASLATLAVSG